MAKTGLLEFFFFFFLHPLLFKGCAVRSDQDATSQSQSELQGERLSLLWQGFPVSSSLCSTAPSTHVFSAETFPLVHFGLPLDSGGRMTRQGHNCALISLSIYPPVNRWVDSCALHPEGRSALCVPSVHGVRSSDCRPWPSLSRPRLDSVRITQTRGKKQEMERGSWGGSEH